MNNKVFYQHPNLMRALGMHETVMEVMVNVLGGGGDSKVIDPFSEIRSCFCGCIAMPVWCDPQLTAFHFFPSRRFDFHKW